MEVWKDVCHSSGRLSWPERERWKERAAVGLLGSCKQWERVSSRLWLLCPWEMGVTLVLWHARVTAFRPDLTLLGAFRNGPRGELGLFRLLLPSRVSLSWADPFGCCTPLSPSVSQREAWMAFCSFCNGGMRTAGEVGPLAEAVRLWFSHLFVASHVVDTQQTLSVLQPHQHR